MLKPNQFHKEWWVVSEYRPQKVKGFGRSYWVCHSDHSIPTN